MAKKTQYAVLGVLSIEPSTGYDIRKFLEAYVSHFWSESFGQIYPILGTLEEDGLVRVEAKSHGARIRKVYWLQDAGRDELHRWLTSSPIDARGNRNELLLKLFFSTEDALPHVLDQVEVFRNQTAKLIDIYEQIQTTTLAEVAHEPGSRLWRATLRHGIELSRAQVRWCDETLRELRA